MAGARGNVGWIIAQRQTAKGAAVTWDPLKGVKNPTTGGSVGLVRETDSLSETDGSRDRGVTYVSAGGVEGSPEFYVRDDSIAFWLGMALGGVATTGVGPNYTHVLTPSNSLPYVSVGRNIGDLLFETYKDCKVSSMSISAEAGQPLTTTVGIQGLSSTRSAAAPDTATPIPVQAGQVYNFNDATVTLSGGTVQNISSFELTIENNVSRQQTDDFVPYDTYDGMRTVDLSFDMIFENLDEYNKFHTGTSGGTTISKNLYTTSAVFSFDNGANNQVSFNLPSIAFTEFPVEGNAGGDPVVVSVAAAAQRSGSPILTATVKNQRASLAA